MAWLGAVVLIGLAILGVDVVRERVHDFRSQKRAERGLPPVVWSPRRRWTTLLASLASVGLLFGILVILRGGNSSSSAKTNSLNVIPTTASSSTTTTTVVGGRPPQQVRVIVVNASGVPNAAQQHADALKAIGYQTVGLANGPRRTGTAVACKAGFEKEAVTLAGKVGAGVTVEPFPAAPPPAAANADCIVELGA